MPVTIGNINLYMGPHTLGAPDNLEETIINFIEGAQKRLEIAIQEVDDWSIANAIIKAKQRGITTTVVLEGDYLKSYPGLKDPYRESGSLQHNREIMATMMRAGVNVKLDFNTSIFHQKFIVRDRESVLTGSTNFTHTGVTNNLNHIFVIHDRSIAVLYYREFKEIMRGRFGKLNEGHDPIPDVEVVSGIPIKVLFAPDHNPEMEIMKQMAKAKNRIDFAIFTFSQSSGIDDQMLLSARAGVKITGVFENKAGNQSWAATRVLDQEGVDTYLASKLSHDQFPEKLGKLHHKLMIIDEQVVIGGSFNYTGPANALNDENIMIFGNLHETDEAKISAQKQFARYALEEVNRIIQVFGREVHT